MILVLKSWFHVEDTISHKRKKKLEIICSKTKEYRGKCYIYSENK